VGSKKQAYIDISLAISCLGVGIVGIQILAFLRSKKALILTSIRAFS